MNQPLFDPTQLLQQETTDSLEDKYTPVPEDVYTAMIIDDPDKEHHQLKIRDFVPERGANAGKTVYVLDVPMKIDAPGVALADGKVVRFSAWLDLSETGALETGPNKNVQLGQLRTALGQNNPGQSWKFSDLIGGILQVGIKHDKDGKFANVNEVAPAA